MAEPAPKPVEDHVLETVQSMLDTFKIEEKKRPTLAAGNDNLGFNDQDTVVVKQLIEYKHSITDKAHPGPLSLEPLQHVPYDPQSDYAKRVNSQKETYFSKFLVNYTINNSHYNTKYVAVEGAYLDLMPRPVLYQNRPNGFAREYVTVYISGNVIERYRMLIQEAGYTLDSAGINIDQSQNLVAFNASYSSQDIPALTIHREAEMEDENGKTKMRRVMDTSRNIEEMYAAIRQSGGAIFWGHAFGEFGVSKQVAVGAPAPPRGSTLKLSFKLMGFHAFSQSLTIRAIKSRSTRSKGGV